MKAKLTLFNIVTARDWQGVPISIDNFNIRIKPINKLEEPNHQAVTKLVQENIKSHNETVPEHIRNKNDVTEAYLNSEQNYGKIE